MRAIKKIAALATGITMIGATVMGAMALDLSTYPAPFVSGCSFNGALVVGEKAAASDVAGAIDIASTLAVSGTQTGSAGTTGSGVTVTGEAVKMEGTSSKLWIGRNLTEVKAVALQSADLPTLLKNGAFMDKAGDEYDYTQKLTFDSKLRFQHFSNSDYKDQTPTLGIPVSDGAAIATYQLTFTKSAESVVDSNSHLTDFEDSQLMVLGNTYDIVSAINESDGVQLQLMGGAVKDVLGMGESKSYTINGKTYDVEVTYIGTTSGTTQVKFKVNGEVTPAKQQGATFKLSDGTQIGVRELLETKAGEITPNQVEFYIGAQKLTLENSQTVQENDNNVNALTATIKSEADGAKVKMDNIQIAWSADGSQFVTQDSSITMPNVGSFKVSYQGYTTAHDEVDYVQPNGNNDMDLKVFLKDSTTTPEDIEVLSTPSLYNYTQIGGQGSNEHLATSATGVNMIYSLADGSKNQYFVATYESGQTGESYLLKVDRASNSDGVDIKNVVTGEVIQSGLKNGTAFNVGSTTITLNNFVQSSFANFTAGAGTYFDRIDTQQGLQILLPIDSGACTAAALSPKVCLNNTQASYTLQMNEADKDGNIAKGNDINVTFGTTTDGHTKVSGLDAGSLKLLSNTQLFEIGTTQVYTGYESSAQGTQVSLDEGPDQYTLKIDYHGGESYGNVYVSEQNAGFGVATTASGAAVCPVSVPAALLDSEVTDTTTQNLIVVGGPCANTVAAKVMGVAATVPECLAGFTEGKAMIKLFDTGAGKVAMLVAGDTALDTRRATRVLKNYKDYAMSGDEVQVTGTTLSDISVSKVA